MPPADSMQLRRLEHSEMAAAARVHRRAFDHQLPWLAGLHTSDEDRYFYEAIVFGQCEVWGALDGEDIVGIIAFTPDWVEQLYILPDFQGRGIGSTLLAIVQGQAMHLQLWTFQQNVLARRFYEARGFIAIEQTDGSRNEEKEPDVLYGWSKASAEPS